MRSPILLAYNTTQVNCELQERLKEQKNWVGLKKTFGPLQTLREQARSVRAHGPGEAHFVLSQHRRHQPIDREPWQPLRLHCTCTHAPPKHPASTSLSARSRRRRPPPPRVACRHGAR
jgi:hypothetical protein